MSESKHCRQVVINNPQGLHARPADLFAKTAGRFTAKIEIVRDTTRVDGKSILEILMLAATAGTTLVIEAQGPDAEAALEALEQLVASNFEENAASDTA